MDTKSYEKKFSDFVKTIEKLRDPQTGCPWDIEQTNKTLTKYMLEEAYEAIEAIHSDDRDEIVDELGDVLLQVVLNAQVGKDDGKFDIGNVIDAINQKMIERHPHVFGDKKFDNTEEVLANWSELKGEKKNEVEKKIKKLGKIHPSTIQAEKIGKYAKKSHFDWPNVNDVMSKVEEEVSELKEALKDKGNLDHIREEIGDIYFSLGQLCRHLKVDSEQTATNGNKKFLDRFEKMYQASKLSFEDFVNLDVYEKEKIWKQIKRVENP